MSLYTVMAKGLSKYTYFILIYKDIRQQTTNSIDMNKRKFQETFVSTEYDDNQTKIMTHQDSASLLTLPVELIHMIFDNLSDFTIICSLRQVCTRLNSIMDAYPGYQTLTEFHLNANHIGVDGGEHFADALRNNKTLLTLDLAGAGVGDEGAHLLAFALQDNTTLTTLDLGSNNINAEGAQYLADALRNNTTLTTLNLRVNDIGDLGAKYLAGALQNNARLMTLDLALNDMREEAVEHFIVALRENRTLTTLKFDWYRVEQNLKDRLKNQIKCNKKT
ncbi:unnamed protein product [Rotaria socialis]|uniref:F-box domain-containing protein n=1 Tax=Rotaria socialis TaxID=392032 RepID=A0A821TDV3_9BILA|nr:unnamed protein product [Rotaria socialis]